MEPARKLRDRINKGEITTGLLCSEHVWSDLVELSVRNGIDYIIVDMEHGCTAIDTVAEVCATGRRMNFPVLIRPRSNDYATLRLAMDMGPCGFLLACVESAADLEVVRDAIHLPPRGRRRPGGVGNRWVPNYLGETWRTTVEDHFIILPQIETLRGLSNVAEVAGHDLTTALAVGPYDLSAELGVAGQMSAAPLKEALVTILAAAKAAGKQGWMIGGNIEELVASGWRFLCFGEPMWILEAGFRDRIARARGIAK
jgi:2-keto-3-deoxy-L-rhamnonate aldolase RhmA